MYTIKLFAGDLRDITAFFRCDLSRAESPLQQWDGDLECWISTQYRCVDCDHCTTKMVAKCKSIAARLVKVENFFCLWDEVSGFIEGADLEHHDASEALESQLTAAVEAYKADDYAACVAALRLAAEIESPHGGTSASDSLRRQLIDRTLAKIMA